MAKRIFDFTLALSGIILSLPLWILIALAIYLEDGLPIFYLQERIGKEARIFKAVKFRSMIKDAEKDSGPVQAKEEDPRITKLGKILRKTAMDELPQLINILKGEMSFVGPRALRPQEREVQDSVVKSVFDYPGFSERIKARPGLTGIAQIAANRDIDRRNKFQYDLYYIRNQSFLLDLYLIIISFLITFKGKWESRENKFRLLLTSLKYQS